MLSLIESLNKFVRLDKRPSKFIKRIFFTSSGKRKTKYLRRNNNTSDKTKLQKMHFGTFSPIKKF